MPKHFEKQGLSFLYPDNWSLDEEGDSASVTIESPEGAFLSVTDLTGREPDAIPQAIQAMEGDYDEIEEEPYQREIAGQVVRGVALSFVYLDLIVRAELFELNHQGRRYLVQVQAEDRDMTSLKTVFEAILVSLCQTDSDTAKSSTGSPGGD